MATHSDRLDLVAITTMFGLCALWGLNQVTVKLADGGISPVMQAGLRSIAATGLVWAWSSWRRVPLFESDGTLGLGLLIAVMFAGEFTFLYWGLEFTTASRAVLFLYTSPFFVAIGAHVFIPGERLRGIQILGLVAAFLGTAIAFIDALRLPNARELIGDAMVVTAAFFWGATTVVVKASRLARISPHKTLFYQLAGSSVLLVALSFALGERGVFAPTRLVLLCFFYQIVVIAFISYLSWFWLVTRYPAFKLSAFSFLTPIFGLLAGGFLLGEPITAALTAAMALVGAGIYLVNRTPRSASDAAPGVGVVTGD